MGLGKVAVHPKPERNSMKKRVIMSAALCALLAFCFVSDSYALIYKYINKEGIVCFADDLQQVPEKFRASAVIVEGETEDNGEKRSSATNTQMNKAEEQTARAETPAERTMPSAPAVHPLSVRLVISGAVCLGALSIFIILSKQAELKEKEKVLSVIRTSLIGIVSVYLIVAHVRDAMTMFGMAGRAIDNVQQQSAEKGKKAAKAMKALDTLFQEAERSQKEQGSDTKELADEKGR